VPPSPAPPETSAPRCRTSSGQTTCLPALDLRPGPCNHCLVKIAKGFPRPLLWLLVIAVVAVPWVAVVRQIRNARPAAVPRTLPTALIWGDRVFTSRAALEFWLRSRGASYSTWAHLHGDATKVFEPGRVAAASTRQRHHGVSFKPPATTATNRSAARSSRQVRPSAVRKSPVVQASAQGTVSPAQRVGEIVLLLLSGIAVAVGLAAPAQLRRLAPVSTPLEFRIAAVATGVTIAAVVATIAFIG
jgi:hypothetical protein